jgi:hypothetical protein
MHGVKHKKLGDNIKVDIKEIGLKAWIGLIWLRIGENVLKSLDQLKNCYILKKDPVSRSWIISS